jgi:hypothetical protein
MKKKHRKIDDNLTLHTLETQRTVYQGTGGVSEVNVTFAFEPAFLDAETGTLCRSRFADGKLAPCHCLDGLPVEFVLQRDDCGHVVAVKATIIAGFVRDERFYSREEALRAVDALSTRPSSSPALRCTNKSVPEEEETKEIEPDPPPGLLDTAAFEMNFHSWQLSWLIAGLTLDFTRVWMGVTVETVAFAWGSKRF